MSELAPPPPEADNRAVLLPAKYDIPTTDDMGKYIYSPYIQQRLIIPCLYMAARFAANPSLNGRVEIRMYYCFQNKLVTQLHPTHAVNTQLKARITRGAMLGHRRTEGCCFSVFLVEWSFENNDTCTDKGGPFCFDLSTL